MQNMTQRFNAKWEPEPNTGCWLWTAYSNPKGYGKLMLPTRRAALAPRVSWELHRGPIPPGLCVLHKCDTPACVNPDHLFLGTREDNNRDMSRKGRNGAHRNPGIRRGERNAAAKLSDDAVRQIRLDVAEAIAAGYPQISVARKHGVDKSLIYGIRDGRFWSHVK